MKNTKQLKQELNNYIEYLDAGVDRKLIYRYLLDLVYEEYQGKTLQLFLEVQEKDNARIKEELSQHKQATQESMHNFSILGQDLLEQKNSRKAKQMAEWFFSSVNGLPSLIYTAKTYFKDGTSKGCANAGVWFFKKFVELLKNNKEEFVEGKNWYNWAKDQGHLDYINIVLEKNQ